MLADKQNLAAWMDAGRKKMREDAVNIEALLDFYSKSLLHEESIKNASIFVGDKDIEGFTFNMYQPFYKSCPIGMILDLEIAIDGKIVPREDIYFLLKGGQRIRMFEARTIKDVWWNIVEPLVVFVRQDGGMSAGEYDFEITLAELVSSYYEHPLDLIMGNIKTKMKVE